MGIQHPEQGIGDFGELVMEFEMDTGGEKCERLDQPFDVRILTLIRLEKEPGGHFGIGLCELLTQLAKSRQLSLIVFEQCLLH